MATSAIKQSSIDFLKKLAEHNDRDWFNAHKDQYIAAHENIIAFADSLLIEMNTHDNIETPSGKASLFRIYKDVRFSKDKTPYNTHWNGGFRRATKKLRGGYYFYIGTDKAYVEGGFWGPNAADIQRIRQDIATNHDDWRKILSDKTLVKTFGALQGEQLTSAPKGYDRNHEAIELLRYKQFLLKHEFDAADIFTPAFAKKMSDVFKKMRPFLDYMSEVLTTDANGISLI